MLGLLTKPSAECRLNKLQNGKIEHSGVANVINNYNKMIIVIIVIVL
jgi:hypothetical protein